MFCLGLTTSTPPRSTFSPTKTLSLKCIPKKLPVSVARFVDMTVTGNIVVTEEVFSELECEDSCLRLYSCVAFNYHYKATNTKKCQLLDKIKGNTDTPGFSSTLFDRAYVEKVRS